MLAESLVAIISLVSLQALPGIATEAPALNGLPVAKYAAPSIQQPVKKNPDSLGVDTTARAAVVLDVRSGNLLYEKDAGETFPIASISKLVTAMVFLDSKPNLDEVVTMDVSDDPPNEKMVFAYNEKLTKRDIFQAMIVGSVNAAANALARTTGGRDVFIRAMNAKTQALGLRTASFMDPTGLDSRNHASAKDVAAILRAALNYPEVREFAKLDKVDVKSHVTNRVYTVKSTNLLLDSFLNKNPYHISAAKTGSLPEAGFCLAQATQNSDGHEIISVVLGSDTHFARFQDTKALTYWTFQNFEWPRVAVASDSN